MSLVFYSLQEHGHVSDFKKILSHIPDFQPAVAPCYLRFGQVDRILSFDHKSTYSLLPDELGQSVSEPREVNCV